MPMIATATGTFSEMAFSSVLELMTLHVCGLWATGTKLFLSCLVVFFLFNFLFFFSCTTLFNEVQYNSLRMRVTRGILLRMKALTFEIILVKVQRPYCSDHEHDEIDIS